MDIIISKTATTKTHTHNHNTAASMLSDTQCAYVYKDNNEQGIRHTSTIQYIKFTQNQQQTEFWDNQQWTTNKYHKHSTATNNEHVQVILVIVKIYTTNTFRCHECIYNWNNKTRLVKLIILFLQCILFHSTEADTEWTVQCDENWTLITWSS